MKRPRARAGTGIATCLLALLLPVAAAAVDVFPLDELRPGMTGTAYTVFSGDSISSFEVTILDRVGGRGAFDLVLLRAEDDLMEHGGISQGMSGSPVYVDGRWLGALAYSFSFATEPLALLTPAAAMLALEAETSKARSESSDGALDPAFFDPAQWGRPVVLPFDSAESPLLFAMGGLDPGTLARFSEAFAGEERRFLPLVAGASGDAGAAEAASPLEPGAALAVELLRGPVSLAAIGTLTQVEGERLWAFGHPFLDEGLVELPLAGARVHAVVPNLMSSYKLATVTEPVGRTLRDGRAGVLGRLGPPPALLPLKLSIAGDGVASQTARFQLARHERLTPVLARLALQGWLQGPLALQDRGTVDLDLELFLDPGLWPEPLSLSERITGEGAIQAAAGWMELLTTALESHPSGPVPVDSLSVRLQWRDEMDALELRALSVDQPVLRAGESWKLEARFRQGARTDRRESWRFPGDGAGEIPPGEYLLHLADAGRFHAWNLQRQPELYRFPDHRALLDFLSRLEAGGTWIIWLERKGSQAVLGGREISLPAYIRQLMPRQAGPEEKNPRRLERREAAQIPGAGEARGHLSIPVTVLPHPVRSKP